MSVRPTRHFQNLAIEHLSDDEFLRVWEKAKEQAAAGDRYARTWCTAMIGLSRPPVVVTINHATTNTQNVLTVAPAEPVDQRKQLLSALTDRALATQDPGEMKAALDAHQEAPPARESSGRVVMVDFYEAEPGSIPEPVKPAGAMPDVPEGKA